MKANMPKIAFLFAAISLAWIIGVQASGEEDPSLKVILERAGKYVAAYEEQLGAIIGEEDYVQDAEWTKRPIGSRTAHRHMNSDFLLVRVGSTWVGVRDVKQVDQQGVSNQPADFTKALEGSMDTVVRRLKTILIDNARYNIGDLARTINVPTFSLTVLHPADMQHFSFKKGPATKIGDVTSREIRFDEVVRPTLVRGLNGEDEPQHGTLWIDPQTGKVLKTEVVINGKSGKNAFEAAITVTFTFNPKVGMLVPATMQERYKAPNHFIECLAKYSNFHRFEVDVKFSEPEPR
jgi:hypothetical protein